MKQLVTALFLCLLPLAAVAQEGTVRYESTIKLDIELPPEMAHIADQIPKSRTVNQLLQFNASEALLKDVQEEAKDEDQEFAGNGGTVRFRMSQGTQDNATYTNFDEDVQVEQRDFLGRTFLITGAPAPLAWRLTDERSEFLGYMCQKAVALRDSTTIEAWFTPEIPVPAGPDTFSGLPGLILVVNVDDGQRSIVAKELTLEPLAEAIEAPSKGKKVTRDEFEAIMEEKMKEMGAQRGGGGARVIFRNQ